MTSELFCFLSVFTSCVELILKKRLSKHMQKRHGASTPSWWCAEMTEKNLGCCKLVLFIGILT